MIRTVLWMTTRRLRAHAGSAIGFVVAVALLVGFVAAIPLYAESASARLLAVEVAGEDDDRIPFGYLFSYNRLSGGDRTWAEVEPVDDLLLGDDSPIAAPRRGESRLLESLPLQLVLDPTRPDDSRLAGFTLASVLGYEAVTTPVTGRLPEPVPSGTPIEAMAEAVFARDNGVEVGAPAQVLARDGTALEVVIVGTWAAADDAAGAATVFADPELLQRSLLVDLDGFVAADDALGPLVQQAQWSVLLDPGGIGTSDVDGFLADTAGLDAAVDDLLSGTRRLTSPATALERFVERADAVEDGLRRFGAPTSALLLVVVAAVGVGVGATRRAELTLLVDRGVGRPVRTATVLIEVVVLTAVGVALGVLAGFLLVDVMASTTSFLRFGSGVELEPRFDGRTARSVAAVAAVVVVAGSAAYRFGVAGGPTRGTTRRLVGGLDLLVAFGAGVYAVTRLRAADPADTVLDAGDTILVAAAISVVVAVAVVRAQPLFGRLAAALPNRRDAVAGLIVARRLEREPSRHAPILGLLVLTGVVSVTTASFAQTLDAQAHDDVHHAVGADLRVVDLGDGQPDPRTYTDLLGVDTSRLTRVAVGVEGLGGDVDRLTMLGIDPETFAQVGFWRDDYAETSLTDLMATLANHREGVLVSERWLRDRPESLGDDLEIGAQTGGSGPTTTFRIVGTFVEFPTWHRDGDQPIAVVDFALIEALSSERVAREVLASRTSALDQVDRRLALGIEDGVTFSAPDRVDDRIDRVFTAPARQGVFGLLTVGFGITFLLTVVGFAFFGLGGLRARRHETGVLRAMGLPSGALWRLVALDLAVLLAVGAVAGAVAGLVTSSVVLPRLVPEGSSISPPLLVEIATDAASALVFVLLGVGAVVGAFLVGLLRRQGLGEATRMGGPS